ncbi:MAG: PilN domain-containing protein [Candidatus Dactylopiibacterium sp.]|nr:PilN domain-containing protein [Candidatus Dactylopiibacterium sp.]
MRPQINLFNPALLPPRPFFQFRTMLLALALIALALVAIGAFVQSATARYLEVAAQSNARVTAREAQLRATQASLRLPVSDPKVTLELAQTLAALQRLQRVESSLLQPESAGRGAHASLRALAAASGDGVWLQRIVLRGPALALQGYAQEAVLVPAYISRLQAQPAFRGLSFGGFELGRQRFGTGEKGPEALSFELSSGAEEATP